MAQITEVLSNGLKLYKGKDTSKKEIGSVKSIPSLGNSREKIEITTLNDLVKRYMGGLVDLGDSLDFNCNYLSEKDSSFSELLTLQESGTREHFTLEFTDGFIVEWDAEVTSVKVTAESGKQITYDLSLAPTSKISFTLPTFA